MCLRGGTHKFVTTLCYIKNIGRVMSYKYKVFGVTQDFNDRDNFSKFV